MFQVGASQNLKTIVVRLTKFGKTIGGSAFVDMEFTAKLIRETEKAFLVSINDNGFEAERWVSRKFIVAGNLAQTELVCDIPFHFVQNWLVGKYN